MDAAEESKEDDSELAGIKDLINNLENSEKTPEVIEWVKSIGSVEAGLVNNLILTFMDNLSNHELANSILRGLRRMNEFIPEEILPQMQANDSFPKAIAEYINQTKVENIEGDGFVLLTKIFSTSSFKSVTNEKFVVSLFNSMAFIQDDEIFKSVVNILIQIGRQ